MFLWLLDSGKSGLIQTVVFSHTLASQNGRIFRLAKQGMPHLGNSSRGDLLAKVSVNLPTKLSEEERKLFEQLGQLRADG